jgi:hypothetical protein
MKIIQQVVIVKGRPNTDFVVALIAAVAIAVGMSTAVTVVLPTIIMTFLVIAIVILVACLILLSVHMYFQYKKNAQKEVEWQQHMRDTADIAREARERRGAPITSKPALTFNVRSERVLESEERHRELS